MWLYTGKKHEQCASPTTLGPTPWAHRRTLAHASTVSSSSPRSTSRSSSPRSSSPRSSSRSSRYFRYKRMYLESVKALKAKLIMSDGGFTYVAELKGSRVDRKMDHLVCFVGGLLALGAQVTRRH